MADVELTRKTSVSKFYRAWRNMINRCKNKNLLSYFRYGGRGITICKKWNTFDGFIDDMYDSFVLSGKNMTLDRTNNELGYSKSNCRWVSYRDQANNRRSNKIIIINGVKCTLENWIRKSVIKSSTVRQRFYAYGWKIEKALGMEVPVV